MKQAFVGAVDTVAGFFPPLKDGGSIEARDLPVPRPASSRAFPPLKDGGSIEARTARSDIGGSIPFPPLKDGGSIEAAKKSFCPCSVLRGFPPLKDGGSIEAEKMHVSRSDRIRAFRR